MRIIEAIDYWDMSRKAASIIAAQIILNPDCVLGLATGETPLGIYSNLIEYYQKGDLDFQQVKTFNLDEYKGFEAGHSQSYSYYMYHNFFDHVNIRPDHINLLDGSSQNSDEECDKYEKMILAEGGIDIQLLGLGHNGHIGFNEPAESFVPQTHCVNLQEETRKANCRFFESLEDVPKKAYTMGIGTIMKSRRILLVVSGKDKAKILQKVLKGLVSPKIPASILQFHSDVTIIADKEALEN